MRLLDKVPMTEISKLKLPNLLSTFKKNAANLAASDESVLELAFFEESQNFLGI